MEQKLLDKISTALEEAINKGDAELIATLSAAYQRIKSVSK